MSSTKLIAALVLAFSLLASLSAFAAEKPAASKEELRRIQEQLRDVKKKAKVAKKQERSVLAEIERMDKSLAAKRSEVRRYEDRLKQVSSEIASTESEMEAKRQKARERQTDLSGRLRAMYKMDRAGGPWVLLASGDYGEVMRRYKYLAVMSEHDKRLMEGYQGDLEDLSQYKDLLNDTRREQAHLYLRHSHFSLQEVAYLLGFHEHSSFFRACSRWFGMTPGQYRARRGFLRGETMETCAIAACG